MRKNISNPNNQSNKTCKYQRGPDSEVKSDLLDPQLVPPTHCTSTDNNNRNSCPSSGTISSCLTGNPAGQRNVRSLAVSLSEAAGRSPLSTCAPQSALREACSQGSHSSFSLFFTNEASCPCGALFLQGRTPSFNRKYLKNKIFPFVLKTNGG